MRFCNNLQTSGGTLKVIMFENQIIEKSVGAIKIKGHKEDSQTQIRLPMNEAKKWLVLIIITLFRNWNLQ